MDTSTLSFWVSGFDLVHGRGKRRERAVHNGNRLADLEFHRGRPRGFGLLGPRLGSGASRLATSPSCSGDGRLDKPTKPVTPGVLRTTAQDSSVSSMRTRM